MIADNATLLKKPCIKKTPFGWFIQPDFTSPMERIKEVVNKGEFDIVFTTLGKIYRVRVEDVVWE